MVKIRLPITTKYSLTELKNAVANVHIYLLLRKLDLLDKLSEPLPDFVTDEDTSFSLCVDAVFHVSEAVWDYYSEHYDVETIYISSPDMMEYYRLCRVYGKMTGVSLKNNPYMEKSSDFVRRWLYQPECYTCEYRLQTKINREWASGIIFRIYPEFSGYYALLIVLDYILTFYSEELKSLKAEIAALAVKQEKEAA